MPYIPKEDRGGYDKWLETRPELPTVGGLAYAVVRLMQRFRGGYAYLGGFFSRALTVGVMVLAVLEFCRRDVADYEDERRTENGDVF